MRIETFTGTNNRNIAITHLLWAYHSPPPCTGTSIVNKNLNGSKLTTQNISYHRKCRRCVSNANKIVTSTSAVDSLSKFARSCSGEQPRSASFPRRGTWSPECPFSFQEADTVLSLRMHCRATLDGKAVFKGMVNLQSLGLFNWIIPD